MAADDAAARLQKFRSQQQEKIQQRAKAEAKLDHVRSQQENLKQQLAALGYDSVEEAQAAAVQMRQDTDEILAQIEEQVS